MYKNKPALLVLSLFVTCPEPGPGPVCSVFRQARLQPSAEASCPAAPCVPGKLRQAQPGAAWVHPVSSVAVCLGAEVGSGWVCGCAVNLSSVLEAYRELRGKEEPQNVNPAVAI